jgi:5-methyltetrahydropteroyltriglutamate--homocysteine methyltransferase
MIWARMDGEAVDEAALDARIDSAVAEVVARQREVGVDIVSDGEYSKPSFGTYINERLSGFEGQAEYQADDMAEFPNLAMRLFNTDSIAHSVFANCVGPVELIDKTAVHKDVERLRAALNGSDPSQAFLGAISPGQIGFSFPNHHYDSHEAYLGALVDVMAHDYRVITDAGFKLQIDSPDMAMAAHCRMVGSDAGDWDHHLPLAVDALNAALDGIPAQQVRLHVCWGNYAGPHHKDIPLEEIIDTVLRANVGTLYVEGANPRHAHEWRVFEQVELPADKSVILGVVDVKTNYVEHPRVVADRLVNLGKVIGKERLIAGTDCGFATLMRDSQVDPDVAWLKLRSLAEGAEIASAEL